MSCEVHTAVKLTVFSAVSPEDGGSMFVRNVWIFLRVHTETQTKRLKAPSSPQCEPQISQFASNSRDILLRSLRKQLNRFNICEWNEFRSEQERNNGCFTSKATCVFACVSDWLGNPQPLNSDWGIPYRGISLSLRKAIFWQAARIVTLWVYVQTCFHLSTLSSERSGFSVHLSFRLLTYVRLMYNACDCKRIPTHVRLVQCCRIDTYIILRLCTWYHWRPSHSDFQLRYNH